MPTVREESRGIHLRMRLKMATEIRSTLRWSIHSQGSLRGKRGMTGLRAGVVLRNNDLREEVMKSSIGTKEQ